MWPGPGHWAGWLAPSMLMMAPTPHRLAHGSLRYNGAAKSDRISIGGHHGICNDWRRLPANLDSVWAHQGDSLSCSRVRPVFFSSFLFLFLFLWYFRVFFSGSPRSDRGTGTCCGQYLGFCGWPRKKRPCCVKGRESSDSQGVHPMGHGKGHQHEARLSVQALHHFY